MGGVCVCDGYYNICADDFIKYFIECHTIYEVIHLKVSVILIISKILDLICVDKCADKLIFNSLIGYKYNNLY